MPAASSHFLQEKGDSQAMARKKGSTPAEFITASEAIRYLADPKHGASRSGRASETRWDEAQARLIKAHVKGRINLIGRKGDVGDFDDKPGPFKRIPDKFFSRDVILGDSLITRPPRKGLPATRKIWREVKMTRNEFEAEFKSASAEAALLAWWKDRTKREGKPPTARDAYLQFAQRQKPKLPWAWLTNHLKTFPKSWRRKSSGRPTPVSGRKAKKPGSRRA
jgi:hypothetical protein